MILKDLEKSKSERLNEADKFVDSCKLLMDNNQARERSALKALGLDKQIVQAEKKMEHLILNERFEKEYESKVFHIDEIKKMCMKYRFFFRNSHEYRGAIPPDLGAIVARLEDTKKVTIGGHSNSFFIMAPPKMFNDYWPISKQISRSHDDGVRGVKEFFKNITEKDPDPMLFVRADADHYVLLKKWGSDVNAGRAIAGFFTSTTGRIQLFSFFAFILLMIAPIILFNMFPDGTFVEYWEKKVSGKVISSGYEGTFAGLAFWIMAGAYWVYTAIIYARWMSLFSGVISTESQWNSPAVKLRRLS